MANLGITHSDSGFTFAGYVSSGGLRGVSFWPRVGTRSIDFAVHYYTIKFAAHQLGIVMGHAVLQLHTTVRSLNQHFHSHRWLGVFFSMLGYAAYHTVCESLHGSSFGKLLLCQVVISEDGKRAPIISSMKRSVLYYIDGFVFGAIAYWAMQRSGRNQRLGDSVGKTLVVWRKDAPPDSV